ncbi:MAG: hypothetical protein AVDCRST_MAG42-37 [uncultured Chthoniobacterales bacterium]|uniref:Uncharacterized protein n=1 Tax=uncultured Chthoniobacterales bacterium TaxID=1836801 RepID=A0A6J4H4K6_9BACT|nr:MAG: hypothetical protein AVDCRST_MAG42-37 [uncultured Chthoniobacterales bacterium]
MDTATLENSQVSAAELRFEWPLCYDAENFILSRIDAFTQQNSFARTLATRMRDETGTLLLDWTDYLLLPSSDEAELRATGYTEDPLADAPDAQKQLWHPEAMLPRVLIAPTNAKYPLALGIRPEHVADFAGVHGITNEIEGAPLSRFRRMLISEENGARFEAIERRAYRGYMPADADVKSYLAARELWQTRRRMWDDDAQGMKNGLECITQMVDLVGKDLACHLVFEEERRYWQKRNKAAVEQKRRQDSLGLGWTNHDHHTFRSSRECFVDLIKAWELLGFHRRERYYAGAQAGWGAQIVEQPVEGIIIFNDVDLNPDEVEVDFSRMPLTAQPKLGTIGLWCGLHGESFLEAGMHHLECRFDFALLREQLAAEGVNTMKPFSDFPFLKQAFTEGERWLVRTLRAERLRTNGSIDEAQFGEFVKNGAIGSHLENLQRKGGFKGFNQHAVSIIIAETDPRKQQGH